MERLCSLLTTLCVDIRKRIKKKPTLQYPGHLSTQMLFDKGISSKQTSPPDRKPKIHNYPALFCFPNTHQSLKNSYWEGREGGVMYYKLCPS